MQFGQSTSLLCCGSAEGGIDNKFRLGVSVAAGASVNVSDIHRLLLLSSRPSLSLPRLEFPAQQQPVLSFASAAVTERDAVASAVGQV